MTLAALMECTRLDSRGGIADDGGVSERVVILSDLHLGRQKFSAGSAEAVRPLWQGATRLILNGDTAEVHHPEHWSQAARQVLRLFDMCEEDGVELTLISGNHDPFLCDLRALTLAHGKVFVTHGDVFHPAVAPWSPRAARMREVFTQAMASLQRESRSELERHLEASQHASHAEWQVLAGQAAASSRWLLLLHPLLFAASMRYWYIYPHLAASFAAKHVPAAEFIITGHTHCSMISRVNGRTIINTGGFGMHRKPLAVVMERGEMRVHKYARDGKVFAMLPEPLRRYELPAPVAAEAPQPVEVSAA